MMNYDEYLTTSKALQFVLPLLCEAYTHTLYISHHMTLIHLYMCNVYVCAYFCVCVPSQYYAM